MKKICDRPDCPMADGPEAFDFRLAIEAEMIFRRLYLITLSLQIIIIVISVGVLVWVVFSTHAKSEESFILKILDKRTVNAAASTVVALLLRPALTRGDTNYRDAVKGRIDAGKAVKTACKALQNSPCKQR